MNPIDPPGGGERTPDGDRLEDAVRGRGRDDALAQLDDYEGHDRSHVAGTLLLAVLQQLLPLHPQRIMSAYYEGYVEIVAEELLGPPTPGRPGVELEGPMTRGVTGRGEE